MRIAPLRSFAQSSQIVSQLVNKFRKARGYGFDWEDLGNERDAFVVDRSVGAGLAPALGVANRANSKERSPYAVFARKAQEFLRSLQRAT